MRFTDKGIAALKPEDKRVTIWADGSPGFGIRVTPAGNKSWIYMYRFQGTNRMLTLGRYPALSLSKARSAYAAAFELVEMGGDPAEQKKEGNKQNRTAMTVSELVDLYIDKWAKPRKKSWKEDERILNFDVVPRWGKKKAKDITRKQVIALLDDIVSRGAPVTANRTLSAVRRMFNFAIERDLITNIPCYRVKPPAKEAPRKRSLSDPEIKDFWNGLAGAEMLEVTKIALKLILATGQRPTEVTSMRHDELSGDWWTVSEGRTKNGKRHRVPLLPLSKTLIDRAKEIASKDSEWVFESPRKKGQPITEMSLARAMARNKEFLGLTENPATPHDLRRTFTTEGGRIGIPRADRKKVLNHAEGDVTEIYDLYEYDKEKRDALEKWDNHLKKTTSLLKVVQSQPTS